MECATDIAKSILVAVGVYSISIFWGIVMVFNALVQRWKKGEEYWYVKERPTPPKCLNDYGKHGFIQLPNSVKIHYVENGDRNKPLMLFVHGFPEFWFSWRHQLQYFAKSHWVVALDMRGYGDSEKPAGISNYKVDLLAKDLRDLVKALGREKCILIGHDWGGIVSFAAAALFPEFVEKFIVLNAPAASAFHKKIKGSLKQFLKSWYVFFMQLPYLPELLYNTNDLSLFERLFEGKGEEEVLEAYKYNWAKKGAWTPPINYYRNLLTPNNILHPKKLPRIEAPTLMIWGEDDIALDKDLAELSRPAVRNMQIEYVKANHFVQHCAPDVVNKLIEEFVR